MTGLDWRWLQSFLAVARTGRLTTAAARLGVDHGTLSRHISSFEQSLRTELFDRRPNGYALTESGTRLLETIEEMESLSLQLTRDHTRDPHAISGVVRIVASDVFGSNFLATRLGRLADMYPDLEIHLQVNPRISALTNREADIAIASVRPERGRLLTRRLTNYSLGLYASPDYLEHASAVATVEDLSGHRLVGYIEDLISSAHRNHWGRICDGLRSTIATTNLHSQMNALLAGAGLGILPNWLASDVEGLVHLLPRDVCLTNSYWMILSSDLRTVPRVRVVREFIAGEISKSRSRFLPDLGQ